MINITNKDAKMMIDQLHASASGTLLGALPVAEMEGFSWEIGKFNDK